MAQRKGTAKKKTRARRKRRRGDRAEDEGRTGICEWMPTGQFSLLYSTSRGCQNTTYTHTHTLTQIGSHTHEAQTVSYFEHVCVSVRRGEFERARSSLGEKGEGWRRRGQIAGAAFRAYLNSLAILTAAHATAHSVSVTFSLPLFISPSVSISHALTCKRWTSGNVLGNEKGGKSVTFGGHYWATQISV